MKLQKDFEVGYGQKPKLINQVHLINDQSKYTESSKSSSSESSSGDEYTSQSKQSEVENENNIFKNMTLKKLGHFYVF